MADIDFEAEAGFVAVDVGRLVGDAGAVPALGGDAGQGAGGGVEADALRGAGERVGDGAVAAGGGGEGGFIGDRVVDAEGAVVDCGHAEAGHGLGFDDEVELDAGGVAVGVAGGVGQGGGAGRGRGAGDPAGRCVEAEAGGEVVVGLGGAGALERVGDRAVAAGGGGQLVVVGGDQLVVDVGAVVGRGEGRDQVGGDGDGERGRGAVGVVDVGVGGGDLGGVGALRGGGAADLVAGGGEAVRQAGDRVGEGAVAAAGGAGDGGAGDGGASLERDRGSRRAPNRRRVRQQAPAVPSAGSEGELAVEVAAVEAVLLHEHLARNNARRVGEPGARRLPLIEFEVGVDLVGEAEADQVVGSNALIADFQFPGLAGLTVVPALDGREGPADRDAAQVGHGVGDGGAAAGRVGRGRGAGNAAAARVPVQPAGQGVVHLGRAGAGQGVGVWLDAAAGVGQGEGDLLAGREDSVERGLDGQGQGGHGRDREDGPVGRRVAADAHVLEGGGGADGGLDQAVEGDAAGAAQLGDAGLVGGRDLEFAPVGREVVLAAVARAELEVGHAGLRGDDVLDDVAGHEQLFGEEDVAVDRLDRAGEVSGPFGRAADGAAGRDQPGREAGEHVADHAVAVQRLQVECVGERQALAAPDVAGNAGVEPAHAAAVGRELENPPFPALFLQTQLAHLDITMRGLGGPLDDPAAAPFECAGISGSGLLVGGGRGLAVLIDHRHVAGDVVAVGAALRVGEAVGLIAAAPGHADLEAEAGGRVAVAGGVGDGVRAVGARRRRASADHAEARVEGDARRQAGEAVGDGAGESAAGRGQRALAGDLVAGGERLGVDAGIAERERLGRDPEQELDLGRVGRGIAVGDDVLDREGARCAAGGAEQAAVAAEAEPGGLFGAAERVGAGAVAARGFGQRGAAQGLADGGVLQGDRGVGGEGGDLVGGDGDVEGEAGAGRVAVAVVRLVGDGGGAAAGGRGAGDAAVGGEVDAGGRAAERVADRRVAASGGGQLRLAADRAVLDRGQGRDRCARREGGSRVLLDHDREGLSRRIAVHIRCLVGDRGGAGGARGAGEDAGGGVERDPGRGVLDRVADRRVAACGCGQRALVADQDVLDEDLERQGQVVWEAGHEVGAALDAVADGEGGDAPVGAGFGEFERGVAVGAAEADRGGAAGGGAGAGAAVGPGAGGAPGDAAFAVGEVLGDQPAGAGREQVVEAAALADGEGPVDRAGLVADAVVELD